MGILGPLPRSYRGLPKVELDTWLVGQFIVAISYVVACQIPNG